ncbi:hypothetical protein AC578_8581 [Pseudocercospora eumusae]|nr:hypothetical protein AC578_8581 [Pseudocercospora eumusae]
MNRGNIPGFYWDADKKKYFKIQASHKVPPDAKYSQSNVTREKNQVRDAKRRKTAEQMSMKGRIHRKLERSRILATCGLQRELGNKIDHYRDEAIVESWTLERIRFDPAIDRSSDYTISVLDDQYLPRSRNSAMLVETSTTRTSYLLCQDISGGYAARPFPLQGRAVAVEAIDGDPSFIFASVQRRTPYCAFFRFGHLDEFLTATEPNAFLETCSLPTIRDLWTSKVDTSEHRVALAGTGAIAVYRLDPNTHIYELQLDESEVFTIDWLSRSTLAYGALEDTKDARHCIKLWDIRSQGQASRLKKSRRITGLSRIDEGGNNLMVSSNFSIDLHDLRMTRSCNDTPLLSIPHTSVGPQLNYDILRPGNKLIAAADRYNNSVQIYSLGTGKHVKEFFTTPEYDHCILGKLRWQEDVNGSPELRAGHGSFINTWAWHVGPDEDYCRA